MESKKNAQFLSPTLSDKSRADCYQVSAELNSVLAPNTKMRTGPGRYMAAIFGWILEGIDFWSELV